MFRPLAIRRRRNAVTSTATSPLYLLDQPLRTWPVQDIVRLNPKSPLTKNCVFAWSGHEVNDLVSKNRGAYDPVALSKVISNKGGMGFKFTGVVNANKDNSSLNFGVTSKTDFLGASAATWAAVLTTSSLGNTSIASQNDGGAANGWQFGYVNINDGNGTPGLGFQCVRTGANSSYAIKETPALNTVFTLVCTGDGVYAAAPSSAVYLNGVLGTQSRFNAASGSTGHSVDTLLVGRHRHEDSTVHQGNIYLVILCNRRWSAAESKSFASNPWQIFSAG